MNEETKHPEQLPDNAAEECVPEIGAFLFSVDTWPDKDRWRLWSARVPAKRALAWYRDANTLYRGRKGHWWACFLIMLLLFFGLRVWHLSIFRSVPPVGGFLCVPVFAGIIALMAHRDTTGTQVPYTVLLRRHFPHLCLLGILAVLYAAAVNLLLDHAAGPKLAKYLRDPVSWLQFRAPKDIAILGLGALLLLPALVGGIFAPPLIALAGKNAFSALFRGWIAGLRNWAVLMMTFLIWGVPYLGVLAVFVLAAAGAETGGKRLLAYFAEIGPGAVDDFINCVKSVVGLLVVSAFFFLADISGTFALMPYFAARDIFYMESPPADDA